MEDLIRNIRFVMCLEIDDILKDKYLKMFFKSYICTLPKDDLTDLLDYNEDCLLKELNGNAVDGGTSFKV